ncbi:LysR family transcriptional regulator [Frigidibacter sp. ROC022]|uniref:LysR family transcriptional regulator n=1 Tax=Frigidibacter sp. ROC022 TaxID=2971796 RepID=UPI00215B6EEE|nr:LysR family transcriptional regulator [Frigidibacter sp. ROC022]MCR8725707.1 LysR family transcriptional regulator [Frigidibacter sp. ROC022]
MIDRLEMFVALAQERHFGRAAERIGVTQPTLSSALKALEESLGVQLVHRGSRFQGLTVEGERAYVRALSLIADARALRDEMRAARDVLTGDLRLGVVPTALPMVADLVAPFFDRHPGVRFQIMSRTSAEILDQVDDNLIDAGITYLDAAATARREAVPLFAESYCLLVAAGDERAARESIGWAELGDLPLCLLTRDMQNRRIVDRNLSEAGVAPMPMVESNSYMALLGHVLTGRWASVVPNKLAEILTATAAVAAVPIEGGNAATVGLIVAPRDPHTPALAALIAQARAMAG